MKIKSGVPLDEILINYENHREKYSYRRKEEIKGWEDIKYKNEQGYNPLNEYYLNKAYGDKYNIHNSEEVVSDIPYWDTKENDAYYSLPRYKRAILIIKEKVIKYKDLILLNFFLMIITLFYANKNPNKLFYRQQR